MIKTFDNCVISKAKDHNLKIRKVHASIIRTVARRPDFEAKEKITGGKIDNLISAAPQIHSLYLYVFFDLKS